MTEPLSDSGPPLRCVSKGASNSAPSSSDASGAGNLGEGTARGTPTVAGEYTISARHSEPSTRVTGIGALIGAACSSAAAGTLTVSTGVPSSASAAYMPVGAAAWTRGCHTVSAVHPGAAVCVAERGGDSWLWRRLRVEGVSPSSGKRRLASHKRSREHACIGTAPVSFTSSRVMRSVTTCAAPQRASERGSAMAIARTAHTSCVLWKRFACCSGSIAAVSSALCRPLFLRAAQLPRPKPPPARGTVLVQSMALHPHAGMDEHQPSGEAPTAASVLPKGSQSKDGN